MPQVGLESGMIILYLFRVSDHCGVGGVVVVVINVVGVDVVIGIIIFVVIVVIDIGKESLNWREEE